MGVSNIDILQANSIMTPMTYNTLGRTFYVCNSSTPLYGGIVGSNGNNGETPLTPFETIKYALTKCVASRGDVIHVLPGHIETIDEAAEIDFNLAGLKLIGSGDGSLKSTIKFTTLTTATVLFSVANIVIDGIRFLCDIDALAAPLVFSSGYPILKNCDFVDSAGKNTTRWINLTEDADGIVLSNLSYDVSDEAGTQKQSFIKVAGASNVIIKNMSAIKGDFFVGVVEMTAACANLGVFDSFLLNTNTTPKPAVAGFAGSTGQVVRSSFGVASGTTYHTNLSGFKFADSYGLNTAGGGMEELGTVIAGSIEGKADNIISAIYGSGVPGTFPAPADPADGVTVAAVLRSTHVHAALIDQNLTGVLGVAAWPVAATPAPGVSFAQVIRDTNNGVNSLLASTTADNGLSYTGTCTAGMAGSTTTLVISELIGYGNDYFNDEYYAWVIKNANAVGVAPSGEMRQITDYVSATGTFTTSAFSVNVEENDEIVVIHKSIANVLTTLGTPAGASVSADVAAIKTVVDAIQVDVGNPSARTNLQSVEAMLGNPDAANKSIYGNIGDFVGDVNLQTLKAALGVPDVAGKPLYTCLVTDRLDNATYGLSALDTQIDTIDGFHDVPAEDAVADSQMRDVIGKKTDTVAGTSLVSLVKVADAAVDAIQTDLGNPSARVNLQTIEAMLGNPDAAGKTVYGNIGDFVGDTNLQTLKAALGIPDVAAKPLYTCLITDRLDNATYGLSALDTQIDTIDGFHDVPVADVVTNSQMRDVLGNKTDAAQGAVAADKSAIAYLKGILTDTIEIGAAGAGLTALSTQASVNTIDGYHDVPVADVVTNSQMRDVVGNKTDAAQGTVAADKSIVAYLKGILTDTIEIGAAGAGLTVLSTQASVNTIDGFHDVPAEDAVADAQMRDVIGKKTDTVAGTSLVSLVKVADAAVDAIQTDLGNPSARTNFQSLETIIGIPDAVNSNLDDMLRTGFDSTAIASNRDGSLMERTEYEMTQLDKIDAVTLAVSPAAGSIGRFIASGGTALGTQLPDSKSLYDMTRQYGHGYVVSKSITYDGSASYNAFTVTGAVFAKVFGTVDVALSNVAATTSVGTATSVAGLIAATAGTAMQTPGNIWQDASPSNFESPIDINATNLIGGGEDITVDGDVTLAAGTITLYCFWKPLSSDGNVVAA